MSFWDVILLSPPFLRLTYAIPAYLPPSSWHRGQRVCVPVGKTLRAGVMADSREEEPDPARTRALFWPLERTPLLTPDYLMLVKALASRYLVHEGQVLSTALPAALKSRHFNIEISAASWRLKSKLSLAEAASLSVEELALLAHHWANHEARLTSAASTEPEKICVLNCDPPWPLRPNAFRQMEILDFLWDKGPVSPQVMSKTLGSWVPGGVRSLHGKGLIRLEVQEAGTAHHSEGLHRTSFLQPSPEQEEALKTLRAGVNSRESQIHLLHGVTGSGKTLVYLHLVKASLEQGRSALVLVPEVALALHIFAQVRDVFQEGRVALYHGYQSAAERARLFERCSRDDQPLVVVGTRSAVFLPCPDWGVIILDEEHDSSFKQEERLSYQAKEVAFFLSRQHKGLLLLGSATPDMRSFASARQGTIGLSQLKERIGPHPLPEVHFVNLLQEKADEGPLSAKAFEALQDCLGRGEQAIILLNRRGYAPLVYCTSCGQVVKCRQCEVGLTYHKKLGRLVCHYCGFSHAFPLPCPECGSHQFIPLSHGTEQVEEVLQSRLGAENEILRLDRDSTRRQGSMEAILDRFSAGRARVLIGTQMCSKGHHFPNVTRVIVVDGDVGLNVPDYRATEKTFQLLVQVAGRSGRGDNPGKVLIQTRNPDHYCWRYVKGNDYEGFFEQEMIRRERVGYPPFVKLGLLRMSFPQSCSQGADQVQKIAASLRHQAGKSGARLLGPAPSPIRMLRGRQRYQCLIKAGNWADIRSICRPVLEGNQPGSPFRLSLDLDPVQML